MEETDEILFETFMGKSFQARASEHLEQVQKTAHESEAAELGRERKKLYNKIKMRTQRLNL